MRQRKADLRARVNGHLALRFTAEGLTSYGGLELFRRYLVSIGFAGRLRHRLGSRSVGGDFSSVAMVQLIITMLVIGARRLRHVCYLAGDPMIERIAGLRRLPGERTLSRWLGRCRRPVRSALMAVSLDLIGERIRQQGLRRLTLDVDGTVVCTGLQVERAKRGYNPHHRKVPSYYPLTAHLAQTGHIVAVRNRAGNIGDGNGAIPFFRELFAELHARVPGAILEVRLDGAFFRGQLVKWLDSRAEYAIKVPFYQWIDLQSRIRARERWEPIIPEVEGFDLHLWLEPWNREVRVAVYRRKVGHRSPKNYQLDLFTPDDGHFEYSAVVTNKTIGLRALWHFMAGRGVHEKVIGELKSGYAFDSIPSQSYAANSTWQILSAVAYNLVTSFQLATGATPRPHSLKRTAHHVVRRIHTLRFELFNRAGLLQHPHGRATLTLANNLRTKSLFQTCLDKLDRAA